MVDSSKTEKQPSATQVAVRKIKSLIFAGDLEAGSNHLETELAEWLGMSRTPVREATLVLAAHGLIEVQPRKGIRIKAVSVQDMAEIYEILTELECLAAKRAALKKLTMRDFKTLLSSISDMDAALAANDRENWALSDEIFHTELVRLGGNRRAAEIVKNVNDQVRRARSITLHLRPLPLKSNEDHRALCTAILKGDDTLAAQIHREHRENARKLLIAILNRSGLKRV